MTLTAADDFSHAFAAVRANRQLPHANGRSSVVDEAALVVARRIRSKLSLFIALDLDQWTRLTAVAQCEVAIAIRHAAYDRPKFPGETGPLHRIAPLTEGCDL